MIFYYSSPKEGSKMPTPAEPPLGTKNSVKSNWRVFAMALLIGLFCISRVSAANRYWVAGSAASWNSTANWSASSGGTNGASVPGATDIAIFDSHGVGGCNINTSISVQGISIVSGYTGTISQLSGNTIAIGTSGYTQAGGTFTGGNSTITITAGLFTLSGGTFTSTSSTFSIGGSFGSTQTIFNHSGGTFNHNSGAVVFNPISGSCSAFTFTVSTLPATKFYDITINAQPSGCAYTSTFAVTAGDTLKAADNLTHTDGYLTGLYDFKNNLSIASTADGGSGTIIADGTGAQTYALASGTGRTCGLLVNKASGTLASAGGNTLLAVQAFTLVSGTFTAPTGNLSIGGAWTSGQTLFTHTGGTFNHNNGTVVFDPISSSCSAFTFTAITLPSTQFYDINIYTQPSGCSYTSTFAVSAGDTLKAADNFTHTDGFLTGVYSFQNNLTVGPLSDGGSGTLIANGTGAQTYTQTSGTGRTCGLVVNKSAGTLASALGNTALTAQSFTLVNGTFTAPTGNFTVGGAWTSGQPLFTQTGGTFNHNNGTVVFDPSSNSCSAFSFTANTLPSTQFYDVYINAQPSGCNYTSTFSVANGDTLKCADNLTHNDGFLTGLYTFGNNLTVNPNSDGGSGTIIANGSGAQTYTQTAGGRTCGLVVNKPVGTTLAPATGTSTLYTQSFGLVSGTFTAPTGNMNVGGPWTSGQVLFNQTGGTFNSNSGTVNFDPSSNSCSAFTFTANTLPSTQFYNLNLNAQPSGCAYTSTFVVTAGDTLKATNNLTHTDGYLTGLYTFGNNLTVNPLSDGGTGTIIATGSGAQTYTQTGGGLTCGLAVNKTAGSTLSPAGGTTALSVQSFSLSSGTFIAPTGNLSIGGPWASNQTLYTQTGGTFNNNNGTVNFNPSSNSCSAFTFGLNPLSTTQFYNIYINAQPSGCGYTSTFAVTPGDTLYANNDLTHNDGFLTGFYGFKNNLTINALADGGTGTIIANGSGAQTYYQASSTGLTCGLVVNKTGGSLSPAVGDVNLSIQKFGLLNGIFIAPKGTMNIGGPWSSGQNLFIQTGGTFKNDSGLVNFNPSSNSCSAFTFSTSPSPATIFYDVNVNALPSGCGYTSTFAVTAGDTLKSTDNFSHNNGYVTGLYEVKNDITISGSASGGVGVILADGAGNQTYTQVAGTPRTCALVVNKPAGSILSPATGTTTISIQGFTLVSGTFIAPTGNMNIGGPWSSSQSLFVQTGGVFTHNNGTVVFDPSSNSCSAFTFGVSTIPSTQFYDVYINAQPSGCGYTSTFSVTAGDTLKCTDNLTHNDGYLTGYYEFKNNLSININSDGGNGAIIADGTGTQTYYQASASTRTCGLIVNKASGTLGPAIGATVLSVQSFVLAKGTFTAPTGNFSIGGPWSASQTIFNQTGGTFTHNGGTVVFDPSSNSCSAFTFTVTPLPGTQFFDVYINAQPSGCAYTSTFSITPGDTLKCADNLTHNDGYLTGYYEFKNNLIVNANADGGTGYLLADGAGPQTYSIAAASPRTCGLIVNKSGGSLLSPASGTTALSVQSFTQANGSFTAPSGNFNVGGSWGSSQTIFNYMAGTFNPNNGTVIFDPYTNSCTSYNFNFNTTAGIAFYNLTLSSSSTCGVYAKITAIAGDTINVSNNLVLGQTTLNAPLSARGNVTISSTFKGGTGPLVFAGNGSQTFDLTGATGLYTGNLVINKTNGKNTVTLLSTCQLATAGQNINFKKGTLVTTSTNTLIVGNSCTVSGMSDSSFVSGPVQKIGNQYFTYPVGQNGLYRPVGIEPPTLATDAFTVQYFKASPNAAGYSAASHDPTLHFLSPNEYWVINRTTGTSNVKVIMSWRDTITGLTEAASHMHVAHWNGTKWNDYGSGTSTYSGNITGSKVVTLAAVSSFSPFTLAADSFLTLSGKIYDDGNALTDNKINGSVINKPSTVQLFVNLLNNTGSAVIDTQTVAADGSYAFTQLYGGNYKVQLSTNKGTIGSAPPATSLPSGWFNTGEGSTTTGDGTPNGVTAVYVASASLKTVNFGINQAPAAGAGTNKVVNPGGTLQATVPANTFSNVTANSDLENKIAAIKITAFPTNATSIMINGVQYTALSPVWSTGGVTVPANVFGLPTQPISIDPVSGIVNDTILFKVIDSAGAISSNTGNAVVQFTYLNVTGTIYHDANGLKDATVNGTAIGVLSGSGLFVTIADSATQIVISSVPVNSINGQYTFNNVVPANSGYTLLLSIVAGNPGSLLSTSVLPSGWANVGANLGSNNADGTGAYGTANAFGLMSGMMPMHVGTANATNANFGVEQISTAYSKTYNGLIGFSISAVSGNATYKSKISLAYTKADSTVAVTGVKPGVLSAKDPEDGVYGGVTGANGTYTAVFTALPDSAGSLLAYFNGTSYVLLTPGNTASPYWNSYAGLYEIPSFNPANLYIFGKDGVSAISFSYAWLDGAGVMGSPASYNMSFSSPLPVQMETFNVVKQGSVAVLSWATATEENSDYFEIQHSDDGVTFTKMGEVKAAGHSREELNYMFKDTKPAAGENYYRIKMVDRDGTYKYSITRSVEFGSEVNMSMGVYPNPVKGGTVNVKVVVNTQTDMQAVINVFDITGKLLVARNAVVNNGTQIIPLDINTLNAGYYQVTVTINGQTLSSKIEVIN